jgi:hypothetical protein
LHEGKNKGLTVNGLKNSISLDKEITKEGGKKHTYVVMLKIDFYNLVGVVEILLDDLDSGVNRHKFVESKFLTYFC